MGARKAKPNMQFLYLVMDELAIAPVKFIGLAINLISRFIASHIAYLFCKAQEF